MQLAYKNSLYPRCHFFLNIFVAS
uniref:Uncharacterized protein n=1 Tax=Lepeophtheirus salmonis TaxID=72036 RepID=A0A0K2VE21_LEPSM